MTEPATPLFEIVPHEDTRHPVTGRPARPWRSVGSVLPAAVLVCLMLVAPLVYTVATSLWVGRGAGLAGTGFGLDHYAEIWRDQQVRHAIGNSLRWLGIAPLVCVAGFMLAWVGRNARRSRAFLIGVIAAPMAVSALVTGIAFRLMFSPPPNVGVVTAVASALDRLGDDAPLPGAGPDEDDTRLVGPTGGPSRLPFTVVPGSGDLVSASVSPGQVVDLALTKVPAPPGPALADDDLPVSQPLQVSGAVTVDGHAVAGIPVSIDSFGSTLATVRTDRHGMFRFDVSDQPDRTQALYTLHIPASAVAPPSDGVAFLGPSWIGWVLAAAFVWGWTGYAVVVFRAGLAAVPRDLLRMARALGSGRLRTAFAVTVPALIPVTAVVLLTVLVAAVRVFDLVLVAPGSVHASADVIGLHWWTSQSTLGTGGAAALAVLLFVLVAVFALVALWGLNREWPVSPQVHPPAPQARRWPRWLVGGLVAVLWLLPFVTLVLTSLHSNRDAAVAGWWHLGRDGLGFGSYRAAFVGGELASVLLATVVRATLSTAVLVVLAVPAAHALAGAALPARVRRVAVTITAVLAVVPVQAVASPLQKAFGALHLAGSPALLTITHVAFGVPFAVVLLRPAFRTVLRDGSGRQPGRGSDELLDRELLRQVWPSVLAVAVLEFVLVSNDLVVSLILSGPQSGSIMLALFGQTRSFGTDTGVLAASGVVSMLVPLLLVLVTGRWVVRGLAAGVTR